MHDPHTPPWTLTAHVCVPAVQPHPGAGLEAMRDVLEVDAKAVDWPWVPSRPLAALGRCAVAC